MTTENTEGRYLCNPHCMCSKFPGRCCRCFESRERIGEDVLAVQETRWKPVVIKDPEPAVLDVMRADLARAIDMGWSNGGTLNTFCSYCNNWRANYEGARPHAPDCLVMKYADLLPKDEP